jgi:hypothetical protein
MVTGSPTSDQQRPDLPLPLILEIFQGRGASQQFPVKVRSLSARGVILTSGQTPGDLNLDGSTGRDSIIHLPTGEIREIRGSLMWARPRGEADPEVVFGLELSNSNLRVRRALEEQLLAYPQDLKNLWDHWDAVHDDYEVFGADQPVSRKSQKAPRSEAVITPSEPVASQIQQDSPSSERAVYWVGFGTVMGGLAIYFLAPESYRLFGVILAAYGSLTIAGKSVWSMVRKRPRSPEQA